MDKRDRVAARYHDVLARVADVQSAFTTFQQHPDEAASITTLADEQRGLLHALIELDRAIFALQYSTFRTGVAVGNLDLGSRSRQSDGTPPGSPGR